MPRDEYGPRVMIAAGGTGGHVFPGIAVARRLRERNIGVVWLGSDGSFEADHVARAGLAFEKINIRGFRRRGWLSWLTAPWRLSFALLQALRILLRCKPDLVLGFGGFAAVPGGLMALALNIPLLIHEQNAVAGLANKLLAPFSRRVLLGFPEAIVRRNAQWVGNPVRPDIAALPAPAQRLEGRGGRFRLLVVGGSRGAAVFNEVVPQALAVLAVDCRPQVRQQAGRGKVEAARVTAARAGVDIELFEFIDDIAAMYAWADLVLCRAGASSVAEVAAAGVAAVFVPYPFSVDDHQVANARFLVSRDAAMLILQPEFTPRAFAKMLERFVSSRDELLRLAVNARHLGRTQADVAVADLCVQAMER